ncbi:hypothetical protein AURANDRAFT_71270, partial [Aureococcus anophagefferens]
LLVLPRRHGHRHGDVRDRPALRRLAHAPRGPPLRVVRVGQHDLPRRLRGHGPHVLARRHDAPRRLVRVDERPALLCQLQRHVHRRRAHGRHDVDYRCLEFHGARRRIPDLRRRRLPPRPPLLHHRGVYQRLLADDARAGGHRVPDGSRVPLRRVLRRAHGRADGHADEYAHGEPDAVALGASLRDAHGCACAHADAFADAPSQRGAFRGADPDADAGPDAAAELGAVLRAAALSHAFPVAEADGRAHELSDVRAVRDAFADPAAEAHDGSDVGAHPAADALADAYSVGHAVVRAVIYAVDGADAQSVGDAHGIPDAVADGSPEPEAHEGADERSYVLPHRTPVAETDGISHRRALKLAVGRPLPSPDFLPDAGAHDASEPGAHDQAHGRAHVLPHDGADATALAGAHGPAVELAHSRADAGPHDVRAVAAAERVAHVVLRVPRERLRLLQLRGEPDVLADASAGERRDVRRQPDLPADVQQRRRRHRGRLRGEEGRGPHGQRLAARREPTPPPSFPLSFLGCPF